MGIQKVNEHGIVFQYPDIGATTALRVTFTTNNSNADAFMDATLTYAVSKTTVAYKVFRKMEGESADSLRAYLLNLRERMIAVEG